MTQPCYSMCWKGTRVPGEKISKHRRYQLWEPSHVTHHFSIPIQSRSQCPRSSVGGIVGLWEKAQKIARNSLHSITIGSSTLGMQARNIRWSPCKELKMILLEGITSLVLLRTLARVLKCWIMLRANQLKYICYEHMWYGLYCACECIVL